MWTDGRLERPGVTVQLICRANGIPQPTIRWYEYRSQIITPFTKRNQLQLLTDSENYHVIIFFAHNCVFVLLSLNSCCLMVIYLPQRQ